MISTLLIILALVGLSRFIPANSYDQTIEGADERGDGLGEGGDL